MALLAFNMTIAALPLAAGNPVPTLPPSLVAGQRGPAFNVTAELKPDILTIDTANGIAGGLEAADYVALQAQVTATDVEYEWTADPEYLTTGLTAHTHVFVLPATTSAVASEGLTATYHHITGSVARTRTLPASPIAGEMHVIFDADGTAGAFNVTIARNANLINSVTANVVMNKAYQTAICVFVGGAIGWSITFLSRHTKHTGIVGFGVLGGIMSLGGNKTIALYDFDTTICDVIIGDVFAELPALNDTVLIGAGAWAKSFDLAGAPAVVLTADGQTYAFALVCYNISGTPTLYAVFGAEAADGAEVAPTVSQINSAMAAAAVVGMDLTTGLILGRAKIQRTAVDTISLTVVDPTTDDAHRGERLLGTLG